MGTALHCSSPQPLSLQSQCCCQGKLYPTPQVLQDPQGFAGLDCSALA